MRTGRPRSPLVLSDDQRQQLESLAHRARTRPHLARRARIVLACAEGHDNKTVAKRLRSAPAMVGKWRMRFVEDGVKGLYDEPRPGAPRQITDNQIENVIVRTLETTLRGATLWSTRGMAQATGLSAITISRMCAFALQPHRAETFQLSQEPLFIGKEPDIVGLYLHPPEKALVLCVDEKTQIPALDRSQPLLPMRPGQPERRSHDYVRHGTTSLFAALEVKSGRVVGDFHARHRSAEFRKFLDHIEAAVPAALEVHLILDNYGTHKTPRIHRWLVRHPRFHVHFTPTRASWLNLVERWFAALTEKQIRRGVHRSARELEDAICQYVETTNARRKPLVWTKTADEILASVGRFYKLISDSGH